MKITSLPAAEGWHIWKKSWDFSKPHWFSLFVISVTTMLLAIITGLFPIFGAALSTVITGFLSFGLMCVTSEIKKNNKVDFKILFAGFDNGVIQKLYTLVFIWFFVGLGQGLLVFAFRSMPYGEIVTTVVSLLVTVAFISLIIFAPALIIWYDIPTYEAIGLNFEAAKKNKAALTVYTLAPAAVSIIPLILMLLAKAFLPELAAAIFSLVLLIVMFVGLIVLCPAIVASLYFLFEAIFLSEPPVEESQPLQQSEPQQ